MSDTSKISAAEVARAWGTSRAYVSKCVKRGCPLDSQEAANAWRVENSRYGVGYRSRGANEAADEHPPKTPRVRRSGRVSTIEQSLEGAIRVEAEALRLVTEAQRDGYDNLISVRIAAYNKARDGRMEAEKAVLEYKEREKILVPWDAVVERVRKLLVPLLVRFRTVGRRAGPQANPLDSLHAELVVNGEVEAAIAEVRPQLETIGACA